MTISDVIVYNINQTVCIPDCPLANFQMVNNPYFGRCDYLGDYCQYGNYSEGCLVINDDLSNCNIFYSKI